MIAFAIGVLVGMAAVTLAGLSVMFYAMIKDDLRQHRGARDGGQGERTQT